MASLLNRILVLNSGSSSLKYALFNVSQNVIKCSCASGIVEKIGEESQNVKHTYVKDDRSAETIKEQRYNLKSHKHALDHVLDLLSHDSSPNGTIDAVGHRVVHGGEHLVNPQLINEDVINAIDHASLLAPLHNPANLSGIKTAMETFPPCVRQVAVFDTAFHATIPEDGFLYGIPYRYYKDHGVRKYGFHGISHQYLMNEASKFLDIDAESLNLITCHLGAGASMSCIKKGISIDTSMGMTPTSGLLMQTRCGDLDPGIIFYLMKHLKLSADEMENVLLKQSGWYGMSGSRNARELEMAFDNKEEKAERTARSIIHRIKSYLGSYYWNLEGDVDAVVFSGGVGENWPLLRELCFEGAKQLGFHIDKDKNSTTKLISSPVEISSRESDKKILVIPTNEELNIASITLDVIHSNK